MILFRIARKPYADLTGSGGLYNAARWHEKGIPILYCASSIALAALEYSVNTKIRPVDTMLLEIEMIGHSPLPVANLIGGPLAPNWPADHGHTRPIGMQWITSAASVALAVPSIVIPFEENIF